jgi:hypothetical protein
LLGHPVEVSSQRQAADLVGSTVNYIVAATVLLQAEDPRLVDQVLTGRVPLLKAAAAVRKRAKFLSAFRQTSPADRAAVAKVIGAATVFDELVSPAL